LSAGTGPNDYVYYSDGGWSWTIPYLAALYTLACRVDPDITPQRFWETGLRTGAVVTVENGDERLKLGNVVQPVALIDAVRKTRGHRSKCPAHQPIAEHVGDARPVAMVSERIKVFRRQRRVLERVTRAAWRSRPGTTGSWFGSTTPRSGWWTTPHSANATVPRESPPNTMINLRYVALQLGWKPTRIVRPDGVVAVFDSDGTFRHFGQFEYRPQLVARFFDLIRPGLMH
jgi:hypothetical protein